MASLGTYAKEKGVKYFLIAFVDLFGTHARQDRAGDRHRHDRRSRARGSPASPPGST